MTDFDIVVVGGGMAALTAGLFGARAGRSTLVLEPAVPGGHLVNITRIEDFPGFPDGVSGYELGPNTQLQAMNAGAEFAMSEVTALTPAAGGGWRVTTADGEYQAGAAIVASGSHARTLGLPGEERFVGRGLSHCASCDAPLFRGQTVGVVGGGDSALQEALTLAEHVGRVVLFHRESSLTAQDIYVQRVQNERTIEVCPQTEVRAILGEEEIVGVQVRDLPTDAERTVELSGLFVYVGLIPNTGFLGSLLDLDEAGRIPTDLWMRTSLPGLFAAGDVRRDSASQAITAAGDGATAAIAADRYLRSLVRG
ncbi:MAG: FAD-dependent oxidoreductase [Chloroflexi bacterium]|nr:FAD-dependent oxidoreductase [Chloroflexota bacterium]